eukprot:1242670-Amphidinium_carterae.1
MSWWRVANALHVTFLKVWKIKRSLAAYVNSLLNFLFDLGSFLLVGKSVLNAGENFCPLKCGMAAPAMPVTAGAIVGYPHFLHDKLNSD